MVGNVEFTFSLYYIGLIMNVAKIMESILDILI